MTTAPHRRGGDAAISTATVRECPRRIGEWTRIGQELVAYARSTERDRIVSVKSDGNPGTSDTRRAELPADRYFKGAPSYTGHLTRRTMCHRLHDRVCTTMIEACFLHDAKYRC